MTEREVLKLALEALELHLTHHEHGCVYLDPAVTAIKEALAQPAQEPVVWMYQNKSTHEVRFQKHMRSFVDHGAWYEVPLYSEPLANQEKTSGSPKPAKPEALRLADAMEYDLDWCDEAAAELRRMHDLLGKANALCRIRAEEIERLKAQPEQEPVAIGEPVGWHSKQYGFVYMALQPHQFKIGSTLYLKDGTPAWRIESSCSMAALLSMSSLPHGTVFYTTPPQSKPLTDEEIILIVAECAASHQHTDIHFARAIERAHGIKELV